jgi:hypothetical protein
MSENNDERGVSDEYLAREKELIWCPDNSAIMFKNRVYRILKKYSTTWYLHDYYESKEYCKDKSSSAYYNGAAIVIKVSDRYLGNGKMEHCYSPGECINHLNFVMEYELIKEEEIPQKIMECIRRIQESKFVHELPMDKIKAHERQHMLLIKTRIAEYILYFMTGLFTELEQSEKPLDIVETVFAIAESDITKYGCQILYDLPNSDGVKREKFEDYLEHLLLQIYEVADGSTGKKMMESDVFARLCEEYPMLSITMVGEKITIDITNHSLLH